MRNSSKFFENHDCEYFPCHKLEGSFNCLFCYCPMYGYEDCPGTGARLKRNGRAIKICTDCVFPHIPKNYDAVIKFLKSKIQ